MTPGELRKLRARMKWTQVQLAKKLGVNSRTIMRYENAQVVVPEWRVEQILTAARRGLRGVV